MLALEQAVYVIDTRGHSAYAAAHIQGALDIPADDMGTAVSQFAKHAKIVLYCA
jgi:rhodanese-related sulfurtransferase